LTDLTCARTIVRETSVAVQEVRDTTKDIREDTQKILEGIENLQTTLPQVVQNPEDQTGYMLNRFLDELTDYAPSVMGDIDPWSDRSSLIVRDPETKKATQTSKEREDLEELPLEASRRSELKNQASVNPRSDGVVEEEIDLDLIGTESVSQKTWREHIQMEIQSIHDDLGPKNGEFYEKGVDYDVLNDGTILYLDNETLPDFDTITIDHQNLWLK
jgi:hypothetical protein